MADLSRRGFFKLTAGAAAMAAIPFPAISEYVPTIFCDGVTCDAEGLAALMAGKPVQFVRPELAKLIAWRGDVLNLAGDFVIKRPVVIGQELSGKTLMGGKYDLHSTFLEITDAKHVILSHMHFGNADMPENSCMLKSGGVRYGVT